jgi:predicted ATPase
MPTLELNQSPTKLHTLSGLRLEHTTYAKPKPLLLLAYLCVEGKKDKRFLADLFWPKASNPLNSLAKALCELRQLGVVENDDTHVWATITSDVNEFLGGLEQRELDNAVPIYQDAFLSGIYLPEWGVELEEWVYSTRDYLAARMREALLVLAEKANDLTAAMKYARRACELTAPLEPDLLPRLYKFLADTPHAAKLQQEAKEFGVSLEQPQTIVSNLPSRGTSFVGRDSERLELTELLSQRDVRLLTLVGQGGVGKTRLAVEVARELQNNFPDGIVYSPLETVKTQEQVFTNLASAFSVPMTKAECINQIAGVVKDRRVLLVLDNAEHMLGRLHRCSPLLQQCPNLKILVTSRERINLEEEWVYTLGGFAVPELTAGLEVAEHNDAVTLFVQRAKKVRQGFTLAQEDLPFVLTICERVEGLPLGIELAASWASVLSCQDIAGHLNDADFLSTSLSNVPERHQSLRHVFEGSWQLLSEEEQLVLAKLSVFRGGFTREAAREVAGASLFALARLVDKSLLRVSNHRYEQHSLLRSFAREKLQDVEGTSERHAAFFVGLTARAEPQLQNAKPGVWFQTLNADRDNLRAALEWLSAQGNAA